VSGSARNAIRARRIVRTALLVVASVLAVSAAAGAAAALGVRAAPLRLAGKSRNVALTAAAAAPRYANWPTFHGNRNLTGLSKDPAISTLNAGRLGVRWMTHTFGPVLSSPVTKYSATLKKTLAYVVNENGDLEAINTASGAIVWSDAFGVPLHATPTVSGQHLWIGTGVSGRMIKVNANTGAKQCQVSLGTGVDFGSPVIAKPPGGVRTMFIGVQDNGSVRGPMMAINDSTCKVEWRRSPYPVFSGTWSPDAYAVNANGVPLVIFGSADPDDAIYALNAKSGATVWRVQSLVGGPNDFGAGAAISPPGKNGIADGVAYVSGKDRYLYAINLTTGHVMWTFNVSAATGAIHDGGRSTAALAGRMVVFGTPVGMAAVNAVSGKQIWLSEKVGPGDTEVLSAPLVTGPVGHQVVVYGDLKGYIEVASLATGQVLYKFQTGGYIVSSAADSAGNVLIGSSDGFLYDLAVGGANGSPPSTTMSAPPNGTIANPGSKPVLAKGTATAGSSPVAAVDVAVQMNGASGPWWNASKRAWQQGPTYNRATLSGAGATRTWTFGVPATRQGSVLTFTARAAGTDGLVEPRLVARTVTVRPATKGPRIAVTPDQAGPTSSVKVSGAGFASGEKVKLSLPGAVLATVTAQADGSFPARHCGVPNRYPYGLTALTAKGQRSGRIASAPLDVTRPWSQFGYDPQHTADLLFDHVLSEEVTPGTALRMMPNWVYSASAAIKSSPAVADGLAFAGDQSGTISAVRIATGGLAWSAAAGGAVTSSPAVDRGSGLVVAGSSNGTVSAYKQQTGKLAWKVTVGGAVTSSPLVYRGVVYVGAQNSRLYAITAKTGKIRWSAALAGPADGSPALDPKSSTVVIGDASGAVTAFHAGATSPSRRWRAQVGGAVDNSPVIAQGRTFVGAANGTVYSLAESSGKIQWSKHVGPSVTGQMAYQARHLYVGASDGSLTALNLGNGSTVWSVPLAGPVTGVSVTDGMLFAESSEGTVTGLRVSGGIVWLAKAGSALAGSPAIMDNAVFVGSENDGLYAYTPFGEPVM
jgi:outer membrane protein assembly factor BamB